MSSPAEESKTDNTTTPTPTPSPPNTVDTRLYQILSSISSQNALQPQHVSLIGTLAFGNDTAKHAIANVDGLISEKLLVYYMDSEYCKDSDASGDNDFNTNSLQFLKTLRACVVNCAVARSQCHSQKLYDKMVQEMKQNHENYAKETNSEESTKIYLHTLQDYVTTLCALCINDEENTALLKATLETQSVNLRDLLVDTSDDNNNNSNNNHKIVSDIQQRMSFLEALLMACVWEDVGRKWWGYANQKWCRRTATSPYNGRTPALTR